MEDIFVSGNYNINDKNQSDGMDLLKSLKDESISCCFFDPQYRDFR